jgi:hypothetical protein
MSIQEQHPSQHQVAPVQLTNENWALCADILHEASLGGFYADGFSLLLQDLFVEVSVIAAEEFRSLLPPPEEIVEDVDIK